MAKNSIKQRILKKKKYIYIYFSILVILFPHENVLNYKDSIDGRKGHRRDFKSQR